MSTDRNPRPPTPLSGGIMLAIGPIIGAVIGNAKGQPSLGMVLGFVTGLAVCLAIWAYDRARRRG